MSTQKDIHEAFLWVRQIYDEGRVLLEDAQRIATSIGFQTAGVVTAYTTVLRENDLPFVFLAGAFFWPTATWEEEAGTGMFVAIDFHSTARVGPYLLVGTVRHTTSDKIKNELLDHTARRLGSSGYFSTKKPTPGSVVYVHTPVATYTKFAGVEEVRHAEMPLTFIDSPEKLRRVIDGAVALVAGEEQQLRELVAECSAGKG